MFKIKYADLIISGTSDNRPIGSEGCEFDAEDVCRMPCGDTGIQRKRLCYDVRVISPDIDVGIVGSRCEELP